jgi:hypothetical protein
MKIAGIKINMSFLILLLCLSSGMKPFGDIASSSENSMVTLSENFPLIESEDIDSNKRVAQASVKPAIGTSPQNKMEYVNLEIMTKLGQLISTFAVIISLIFVALQMRHNTKTLRIQNYSRTLDRMSAMQANMSMDENFMFIVSKGVLDPSELTSKQRIQFTWALYEMFGAFEFLYHQRERDALPDEVWERWSFTIAWWSTFPGVQEWWEAKPTPFSADFSEFVANLISTVDRDNMTFQRWQQFVKGTNNT